MLATMLEEGDAKVAGALVKTHEMEFRKLGLFEKDNSQKQKPVMFNIDMSGMLPQDKEQPKEIEGEVIDGEGL